MEPITHNANLQAVTRLAGLLYLIVIATGLTAELGIRGRLITFDDAHVTASAILSNPGLFRLGIAADLVMALCDAGLAILFYLIFKKTAHALALSAMVLRLLQTALIAANLMNLQAAWLLLSSSGGFGEVDRALMALQFLQMHAYGYDLGLVFFGVNSLLMARLVWRSNIIGKPFSLGLGVAGTVYLIGSGLSFFAPEQALDFTPVYGLTILAEVAFCMRLLIGLNTRQTILPEKQQAGSPLV